MRWPTTASLSPVFLRKLGCFREAATYRAGHVSKATVIIPLRSSPVKRRKSWLQISSAAFYAAHSMKEIKECAEEFPIMKVKNNNLIIQFGKKQLVLLGFYY